MDTAKEMFLYNDPGVLSFNADHGGYLFFPWNRLSMQNIQPKVDMTGIIFDFIFP